MSEDGTVSKSEFARLRGVSAPMVTKWVKASRLVMVGDRVHVEKSQAALAAHLDPARGGKGGKSARTNTSVREVAAAGGVSVAPPAPAVAAPPPAPGTYNEVRTARESYAAKQAELDYRERAGELIETARIEKAIVDAIAPIVSALGSLSAQIGPKLAAESDARKVQNMLDDAVDEIRQEIADTLRRMIPGAPGTRQ